MNRSATPLRSYSQSRRATRPGLAGIGARLADQRLGGFIQTHQGTVGIMRLPVGFQHVFHGGDEGRVGVRRDRPLPFALRFERVFFESPSDRVVAGLLDDGQFDALLLEQARAPTSEPLGSRRAGRSDQFRRRRPVENPPPGGVRIVFALQRRLQPFLDESRPETADIVDAGVQRRRDRAVAPTFPRLRHVRLRQDTSLRQQSRRALARVGQSLQPLALDRATYFLTAISLPATNHLHRGVAAAEIRKNTTDSRTPATS